MNDTQHPAGYVLQAFHDGELDSPAAAEVEAHCQRCTTCQAELDDLMQVGLLLAGAPAPDMPRTVWHRVKPGREHESRFKPAFGFAACAAGIVLGILLGPISFDVEQQIETQVAWSETVTVWNSGTSASLLSVYQTGQE